MTRKKRHNAMEIKSKLDQADILSREGQTQNEIAKALGISVMTFHRWRKARRPYPDPAPSGPRTLGQLVAYNRATESDRPSRIAELQLENSRLRRLVTDLLLEKMRLEDEQYRQAATSQRATGSRAS